MAFKQNQLKELIPVYLNGTLSEAEKTTFEKALKTLPELKQEFSEFMEIHNHYDNLELEMPKPSPDIFNKVISRVRSETKSVSVEETDTLINGLSDWFKDFFSAPAISWGVAVVQFGIILFMIGSFSGKNKITTLSGQQVIAEDGIRVNIVFNDKATAKEISILLRDIEGHIINGPSREGLYTLVINNGTDELNHVIKNIKEAKIVTFVKKAY